eukprot:gene3914-2782_t
MLPAFFSIRFLTILGCSESSIVVVSFSIFFFFVPVFQKIFILLPSFLPSFFFVKFTIQLILLRLSWKERKAHDEGSFYLYHYLCKEDDIINSTDIVRRPISSDKTVRYPQGNVCTNELFHPSKKKKNNNLKRYPLSSDKTNSNQDHTTFHAANRDHLAEHIIIIDPPSFCPKQPQKKRLLDKENIPFIVHLVLMACITGCIALCFGYNVTNLKSIKDKKYDFETSRMISDALLLVSRMPFFVWRPGGWGCPTPFRYHNIWQHMDVMFKYGPSISIPDEFGALDAMQEICLILTHELETQISLQVNPEYAAQVGLECISQQVQQLYFHTAFLTDVVYKDWDKVAYYTFSGLTYNELAFPDCTGYFSEAKTYSFQEIINNAPTTSAEPLLKALYTSSPLSADAVEIALNDLEVEVNAVADAVETYWRNQLKQSTIISIAALVALVLTASFMIMSPFFYTRGLTMNSSKSVETFQQVDNRSKVLAVNAVNIIALKEDPKLLHFLEGTFLVKFIGFIRRARPFIQQTAFGDIENVVLSSADNGLSGNFVVESSSSGNRAAAHGGDGVSNEDDQRAQELRSETGLQVTQGTVLCLSRSGIVYDDREKEHGGLRERTMALNKAIVLFENVANIHHGAIHTITDRFVFMTWNVTSSCPEHELEALTAALEIANALRNVVQGVSMTVASSLLLAGTVEAVDDRTVMICGPAMLTCEKMQALNRYHGTTIVMDKSVASKAFSLNIPGCDYCSVPLSLYRPDGRSTTPQVAYGLFPCRLTEPLKAWITQFKEFPMLMEAHRIQEMLDIVEEYKRTYAGSVIAGRDGSTVTMDRTVNFWTTAEVEVLGARSWKKCGTELGKGKDHLNGYPHAHLYRLHIYAYMHFEMNLTGLYYILLPYFAFFWLFSGEPVSSSVFTTQSRRICSDADSDHSGVHLPSNPFTCLHVTDIDATVNPHDYPFLCISFTNAIANYVTINARDAILMLLLLSVTTACALCFIYSVRDLSAVNDRIYDFNSLKIAADIFLKLGYQPLASQLEKFGKRKRVTLDMSMVNLWLSLVFTYGVNPDPSFQNFGLDAVELIGLHVTEQVQALTVKQVDQTYMAQTGLICVSQQVNQLFSHNSLLLPQIIKEWGQTQIQLFYGSSYDQMIFPDCTGYLSAAKDFSFEPSPLTSPVIVAALDALASTIAATEKSAEEYWQSQKKQSLLATVFSLISTCLMGTILLLMPFFYTRGNMEVDSGLLARYGKVEAVMKILTVHAVNLTALKEDPTLLHFLEGDVPGEIYRFHPPRPANVVLSTLDATSGQFTMEQGGNTSTGGDNRSAVEEEDQRGRDLRLETGLQVAYGTVMILARRTAYYTSMHTITSMKDGSRGSFVHDCESVRDRRNVMNMGVGMLEKVVNARHGAIHTIADRCVVMSWNVTSSCPEHELNALSAGVEIMNALYAAPGGITISIASSLLLAGTVEEGDERTVMICGPAMLTCEKILGLNHYHHTLIAMDKNVASKVFSLSIPGQDYCAVPISLYRPDGRSTTPQVAYGLFPCRLTEPLKAWITQFKEFPMLMEAHRIQEMLDIVEEYKRTYAGSVMNIKDGPSVTMTATVEFWIMALHVLLSREHHGSVLDYPLMSFRSCYFDESFFTGSSPRQSSHTDLKKRAELHLRSPPYFHNQQQTIVLLLIILFFLTRFLFRTTSIMVTDTPHYLVGHNMVITWVARVIYQLFQILFFLFLQMIRRWLAHVPQRHLTLPPCDPLSKWDVWVWVCVGGRQGRTAEKVCSHVPVPATLSKRYRPAVPYIYIYIYVLNFSLYALVPLSASRLAFRSSRLAAAPLSSSHVLPSPGSLVCLQPAHPKHKTHQMDSESQKEAEKKQTRSQWRDSNLRLAILMLLLLSITTACALCFIYSVRDLSAVNDRIYDFNSLKIAADIFLKLGYQPVVFGTPAAGSNPELASQLEKFGKRKRVTLDMSMVNLWLSLVFTYGVNPDPSFQNFGLDAVELIGLHVTEQVQALTVKQVDQTYTAQTGLICVSEQVNQLFSHNSLLLPQIIKEWGQTQIQLFYGSSYDQMIFPDCTGYLSAAKDFSFEPVILNGPTISSGAKLTQKYQKSPLTSPVIVAALDALASTIAATEKSAEDPSSTVLSLVSTVLVAVAMLLTPVFYTRGVVATDNGVMVRYRKVESAIKILTVNIHSLTALKEDPTLHHFLEGTFLTKFIGFIRRARPFIQQTAFGDVENVVLSTLDATSGQFTMEQGGNTSTGGDNRSAVEEEDQRGHDLRLETGLQVAYGTVMILARRTAYYTSMHTITSMKDGSRGSFVHDCESVRDRRNVMNMGVGMLEKVVNARHGAIHTIADRCVVMSWNVTSSCPEHELNALSAGVEIMNALYAAPGGITISIASSLLLAGTVEEGDERTVMICGPAMLTCEKILGLNHYHHTLIAMDKNVASKVFSLSIPGQDYCSVPLSLYRPDGRSTTPQVAYGLFPCRLTEPLKAWITQFKEFPMLMEAHRIQEMLDIVEEYKRTYAGSVMNTKDGPSVTMTATVEFWIMVLHVLLSREHQ